MGLINTGGKVEGKEGWASRVKQKANLVRGDWIEAPKKETCRLSVNL